MVYGQPNYEVSTISNYTFGTKQQKLEKDKTVEARFNRMKAKYVSQGVRRSVEGVLLVSEHNHPHILLLQIGNSFFKLPGGQLRVGEDEVSGLKRKLDNNLGGLSEEQRVEWNVGQCVGVYYRPSFDTVMYPYLPAHVSKPKEIKKIFFVPLPKKAFFAIPNNLKLLAVPLFEVYDNVTRYGPIISAMPQMLSRLQISIVKEPSQEHQEQQPQIQS
eukprot:TRINITY_DN21960_c0_g1_i1.p1 TRINITY_DN21960_c0_g1~~TRINITY_DN21960_c0_g1_i1.p1  ORF type:complete len:216 (-),score=14.63 TRINITY_DN21960_c0_g1_i1:227-874(-)